MSIIPVVLLNALREYNFVGSPFWRMSDWKDLVQVELTFHKTQPTSRFERKRGESRRQMKPRSCYQIAAQKIDASTPTADAGEGDATTSRADTADRSTYHHQTSTPATDSTDHAIADHQETYNTASFSRIASYQAAKDQVTGDNHCKDPNTVLPRQYRGRISSTWEVRAQWRLFDLIQGHRQSYKTSTRRWRVQRQTSSLLCLSSRQQALGSSQGTNFKVLRRILVRVLRETHQERQETDQPCVRPGTVP